MRFRRTKNVLRFFQIKYVILKNLIRFWIASPASDGLKKAGRDRPEVVRETMEELGPTFIKFGQLMSERPDIVSEAYADELSKLQSEVPSFDDGLARSIIDDEIGLSEFDSIEDEPLASASIAQVYRGRLRGGQDIVVKVRRPGIERKISTDLRIMKYVSRKIEARSRKLSNLRISKFVDEFARWTLSEVDMKKEAENVILFRENLKDRENEFVPKTYPELNTEKALVLEYVEGVKSDNREKLEEWGVDMQKVAENAIDGGIKQALWDGFFHADLHKSNFLITKEGKIAYLDFGMMGEIDHESSEKLGLMLLYFIREDIEGVVKLLEDLGNTTEDYDRYAVKNIATRKVMRFKTDTESNQSITRQMLELFIEVSDHGVYMPANNTLLLKNFITIEGLGHSLHEDFQVSEKYEETIEKIIIGNNSSKELLKDIGLDLISNKDLITKMPSKINSEIGGKTQNRLLTGREGVDLVVPSMVLSSTALIIFSKPSNSVLLGAGIIGGAISLFSIYFKK